jgi:hypothetical protein
MSKKPAKSKPDKLKLSKATVKDLSVSPSQANKLKAGARDETFACPTNIMCCYGGTK